MSTSPIGTTTPAASSSTSSSSTSSSSTGANSLNNIDISQFLQMMIAQLQNQDPMDPMSNSDIMQQISDMQQISTSNNLNTTLSSIALGQTLSNATSLIGKTIDGLDDSGNPASGVVSKVSVVNGQPKLTVGTQTVSLDNIQDLLPAS